MIVFDASTLISAALKADSIPERTPLRAEEVDVLALSAEVDAEISEVLARPKFTRAVSEARRRAFLTPLRAAAFWFEPTLRLKECRDAKNDKYLELALAASAETIVSSDRDLLVLIRGGCPRSLARGNTLHSVGEGLAASDVSARSSACRRRPG